MLPFTTAAYKNAISLGVATLFYLYTRKPVLSRVSAFFREDKAYIIRYQSIDWINPLSAALNSFVFSSAFSSEDPFTP